MALSLGAADFLAHPQQPGPLSFWLRTTSAITNAELVSKHNAAASTDGFGLLLNNTAGSGKLTIYGKTAAGADAFAVTTGSHVVNDGNWHHIGLNLWYSNSKQVQVWVDGNLDLQVSPTVLWGGSTQSLRFGRSNDTFWGNFVGEFAEIALWGGGGFSAYLTQDQWVALAKGAPPWAVNLLEVHEYMPLVRDVRDLSGFGGQPTLTGGSFTDHPRIFGR